MKLVRASIAPLLMLLPSAMAGADEVRIRDITLVYDPATWRVEPVLEGSVWRFACVTRDCRGRTTISVPFVYVIARPTTTEAPSPCAPTEALRARDAAYGPFTYSRASYGGIEFNVTTTVNQCRAVSPWLLEACGAHGASEYWITTGFGFGTNCGPESKLPPSRFEELLKGVALTGAPP